MSRTLFSTLSILVFSALLFASPYDDASVTYGPQDGSEPATSIQRSDGFLPFHSELDVIGDTMHVGYTWYDVQHNGQVGRMIAYDPETDVVHMVFMQGQDAGNNERHVRYLNILGANSDNPVVEYREPDGVDNGTGRSGFATLPYDPVTQRAFPSFHHDSGDGTPYISKLAVESRFVQGFWDLFASPDPAGTDNDVLFPRSVMGPEGYVHTINSEFPAGNTDAVQKYYMRWLYDPQNAIMEPATPGNQMVLMTDQAMMNSSDIHVNSTGTELAYTESMPRFYTLDEGEAIQWNNDIWLWRSHNGGASWDEPVSVTDWIAPNPDFLPDTLAANGDTLRSYVDCSVLFDADDNLHAIFTTPGYWYLEGIMSRASRIFHWDEFSNTFTLVADGTQGYLGQGEVFALTADRPSIYSDPDTGILWVVYRRLSNLIDNPDSTDFVDEYACGDIYLTASPPGVNNGLLWAQPINLTDTKWLSETEMTPGEAQAELDPSVALASHGDYLHLMYVVDTWPDRCTDTGATLCPVVYQRVNKQEIIDSFSGWVRNYPIHIDSTGFWEDENNWAWNGFFNEGIDPFIAPLHLDVGGNEDLQHLINHMPTISWDFFSNTGTDQTAWQVQVSTFEDFSEINMWDTGVVEGDDEQTVYSGNPPVDGDAYFLRVQVHSDDLVSDWYEIAFRMNTMPTSPELIQPADDGEVLVGPLLEVSESVDGDEDPVRYIFTLYANEELTQVVATSPRLVNPQWLVSPTPANDRYYWWNVVADDGYQQSFPTTWSFFLNLSVQPPDSFRLISPEDGMELDTLSYRFEWEESHEWDEGDSLTYWLQVSLDNQFTDTLTTWYRRDDGEAHYTVPVLLDDSNYWWRVLARDTNTGGTMSDEVFQFSTAWPQPPVEFDLLQPANGTIVGVADEFTWTPVWQQSSDPDPGETEQISYFFDAHLFSLGLLDTTIRYEMGQATDFTFNLPDSLNLDYWDESIEVLWRVYAVSGLDTVMSSDEWIVELDAHVNDVVSFESGLPLEYSIASCYPNPFNAMTTVVIGLPQPGGLRVELYNVLGERVATLVDRTVTAGYHSISVDGRELSSGIYFLRATVPGKLNDVRKVVLLK